MTKNKEKYFDELLEYFQNRDYCGFMKKHNLVHVGLDGKCHDFNCGNFCLNNLKEWLEQEYIESIKLTEDEKVILKNIDKKYQYIVRNQNGNLKVCNGNVEKCDGRWVNYNYFHYFCLFNHLFQFIKWEDEEPYEIDELLKQNGVER